MILCSHTHITCLLVVDFEEILVTVSSNELKRDKDHVGFSNPITLLMAHGYPCVIVIRFF